MDKLFNLRWRLRWVNEVGGFGHKYYSGVDAETLILAEDVFSARSHLCQKIKEVIESLRSSHENANLAIGNTAEAIAEKAEVEEFSIGRGVIYHRTTEWDD